MSPIPSPGMRVATVHPPRAGNVVRRGGAAPVEAVHQRDLEGRECALDVPVAPCSPSAAGSASEATTPRRHRPIGARSCRPPGGAPRTRDRSRRPRSRPPAPGPEPGTPPPRRGPSSTRTADRRTRTPPSCRSRTAPRAISYRYPGASRSASRAPCTCRLLHSPPSVPAGRSKTLKTDVTATATANDDGDRRRSRERARSASATSGRLARARWPGCRARAAAGPAGAANVAASLAQPGLESLLDRLVDHRKPPSSPSTLRRCRSA